MQSIVPEAHSQIVRHQLQVLEATKPAVSISLDILTVNPAASQRDHVRYGSTVEALLRTRESELMGLLMLAVRADLPSTSTEQHLTTFSPVGLPAPFSLTFQPRWAGADTSRADCRGAPAHDTTETEFATRRVAFSAGPRSTFAVIGLRTFLHQRKPAPTEGMSREGAGRRRRPSGLNPGWEDRFTETRITKKARPVRSRSD